MVIVDRSGAIVLINSQVEQLFGYQRAELIGKSVDLLVPKRFGAHHHMQRDQYFSEPKPRPMGSGLQLWGRRKDGS